VLCLRMRCRPGMFPVSLEPPHSWRKPNNLFAFQLCTEHSWCRNLIGHAWPVGICILLFQVWNYQIQVNRDVPNYRNFLQSNTNNASLAAFICQYICDYGQYLLPAEKSVLLAGGFEDGEVIKVVTSVGVSCLEETLSSQEEADTRLMLHAIKLSREHQRIIIRFDDTDILVLLVYYGGKDALAQEVYIRLRHHECSVQSWKANSLLGSRQECGGSTETGNIPGRHYILRHSMAIRPPNAR